MQKHRYLFLSDHLVTKSLLLFPTTIIPKCPPATIAFKTPGSPPPNLKHKEYINSHKKKIYWTYWVPGIKIKVANKWLCSKQSSTICPTVHCMYTTLSCNAFWDRYKRAE